MKQFHHAGSNCVIEAFLWKVLQLAWGDGMLVRHSTNRDVTLGGYRQLAISPLQGPDEPHHLINF